MFPWQEPCSLRLERYLIEERNRFLISSIAAGVLVVIVSRIFSSFVVTLPWDASTISVAVAMGLCLSLQLVGIPWFLSQMKEAFHSPLSPDSKPGGSFFALFEQHLGDRIPFYATVCFVLLAFVALQVIQASAIQFFAAEHTVAALLFDIFNNLLGYSLLFLLAVILWMLLVVASTLNDAQRVSEQKNIPVDILAPDGVGGLGSIQALVRSLFTYYFVIVALLIISYLSPTRLWSYEALFVIALFIVGILFFFLSFGSIRNIVRRQVADEIGTLNERIRIRYDQLKKSITAGEETDLEAMKKVQAVLDVCYTERNRLMTLYEKNKAFDIRTIAQSVASVIVPILAFLVQLSSGADALRKILSVGVI
jgi:hypothetical protein